MLIFDMAILCAARDALRQLSAASTLPVYELDRAHVMKKHAHIRPFEYPRGFTHDPKCAPVVSSSPPGHLHVNGWRLAHAIKKADMARRTSMTSIYLGALAFLLDHPDLLKWDGGELRIQREMASAYADFSKSSTTGRIAQGVAWLFMEDRGYCYGERFPTFLNRALGRVGYDPPWRTRSGGLKGRPSGKEEPDFIFENSRGGLALAESKGSIVNPCSDPPPIKSDLKAALGQLDAWLPFISPSPQKAFAIGTYLREFGDPFEEPSLVAFVDPEGPDEGEGVPFPSDLLRRSNYAAWLRAMNLTEAADRLISSDPERAGAVRLPITQLGGREFALNVNYVRPHWSEADSRDWKESGMPFWGELPYPYAFHAPSLAFGVTGIETRTLEAVSSAIRQPGSLSLMELDPVVDFQLPQRGEDSSTYGSVFSDGTFQGEIIASPNRPPFETEAREFIL
jgi:hypothetical protein